MKPVTKKRKVKHCVAYGKAFSSSVAAERSAVITENPNDKFQVQQ